MVTRRYVPLRFVGHDFLCSDAVLLVPDGTLCHFGVLQSRTHNARMRAVAGRLEGRYRYSAGIVYNNFIWPEVDSEQKAEIANLSQTVLAARENYPHATIARMYKPEHDGCIQS
ncbi:MAG: type IIL restriction-modification enzyme MmeI [Gleimia sp.]